jgi:hypothetical protein
MQIKKDYEILNVYNTRNECNNNLKLLKCNTTLMKMFYVNRGIELFNRLPSNIKIINNNKLFKYKINKLYMQFHDKT